MPEHHSHSGHHGEHFGLTETTPQGTQRHSVEHGHEVLDVNLPAIFRWFLALVVTMVVTYVTVWVMWQGWDGMQTRAEAAISPMLLRQAPPPEPRLLPNPFDSPADRPELMLGPGKTYRQERDAEDEALSKLRLLDPEHRKPTIPTEAISRVLGGRENAGVAGTGERAVKRPSDGSGGLALESTLR
jgi:hypothetical protein